MKKLITLIIIAACTTLAWVVSAKGAFNTITIYNPATDASIKITEEDSDLLMEFFLFDPFGGAIQDVPELENGYEIQRGYSENGNFEPFDMVVFYPATDNTPGYIHYIGLISATGETDGWSEYDNGWYHVNSLMESELNAILMGDFEARTLETSNYWQNILKWLSQTRR